MPQDSTIGVDTIALLTDSLRKVDSVISVKTTPNTFFGNFGTGTAIAEPIPVNDDWMLGVILIALGLLAYLQMNYSKRLADILRASYDSSLAKEILRGENALLQRTSLMLLLVFWLSFSSLIYLGIKHLFPEIMEPYSILTFFEVMILVLFAYMIKIGMIRLIGFIFRETSSASEYIFSVFIFLQVSGLLILPIVILLNYSYIPVIPLFLGALIFFVGTYILRIFRSLGMAWGKAGISGLHLFYYFCTLELIPAVVLTKSITMAVAAI